MKKAVPAKSVTWDSFVVQMVPSVLASTRNATTARSVKMALTKKIVTSLLATRANSGVRTTSASRCCGNATVSRTVQTQQTRRDARTSLVRRTSSVVPQEETPARSASTSPSCVTALTTVKTAPTKETPAVSFCKIILFSDFSKKRKKMHLTLCHFSYSRSDVQLYGMRIRLQIVAGRRCVHLPRRQKARRGLEVMRW